MIFVLDSDHLSLHQRGHEALKHHLIAVQAAQICITIVSAEELLRGRLAQIRRATRPDERIQAYHWLSETITYISKFIILPYDSRAEAYFQIFLDRKIRIGTQDLKIAAIVQIPVSRDRNTFPASHATSWALSGVKREETAS
ncbi:MAG: type II toxin-antitoxin system VapC family toxin [Candidatus Vecturithrix sp.]|jgi:tRNA(fMet)-specific endonuclease VapC|nr:type II toxin-antitoxin system VapC family toxin [Candidatus Vecturithrix sp.]